MRIPPCYADGGAFASRHGQADFLCGFKGFIALDAGPDLVRFACVVWGFVVEELDGFQVVGPDGQGACAYGFPVVASQEGQRIGRGGGSGEGLGTRDLCFVSPAGCCVSVRM